LNAILLINEIIWNYIIFLGAEDYGDDDYYGGKFFLQLSIFPPISRIYVTKSDSRGRNFETLL